MAKPSITSDRSASLNSWIFKSSAARINPKPSTCETGNGIAETVTSASNSMCWAMICLKYPVQLVARQYQNVIVVYTGKMMNILPDRIRRSLIPVVALLSLFGRRDVSATTKRIEPICMLMNMAMQRSRVELREPVDAVGFPNSGNC